MAWYWIALIIYGGIGFLLGMFISILDWQNAQYAPLYIVMCTIIGVPLFLVGIFEWMISGEG